MPLNRQIGQSASEDRLEKLIEERLQPGTDKKAIDTRIWDLFGEEWAVMFTDLSGFSRGVEEYGIIHFLQTIYESQRLLIPVIDNHDGILLKVEADSLLIIFRNPMKAVDCAINMMKVLEDYNIHTPEIEDILLCVGIGFGKMLRIGDHDVYGAEVNAASKLGEDTAEARQILITENVRNALVDHKREDLNYQKMEKSPPGARASYELKYTL
ncbi:MAG: adenylate/guanylate cyclase domain-containing protein [Spirochaetia bacterium]|nr:adenylate/guanylate cyclase domain-containing protein [Spirochaetia bacterium]